MKSCYSVIKIVERGEFPLFLNMFKVFAVLHLQVVVAYEMLTVFQNDLVRSTIHVTYTLVDTPRGNNAIESSVGDALSCKASVKI